jgi:hypothetical protein
VIAHKIQWLLSMLIGRIKYLLEMGQGLSLSIMVGKYATFLRVVSWLPFGSQCASPKFNKLSLYQLLLGHLSRSSLVIGMSPMSGWELWVVFQCLNASSYICLRRVVMLMGMGCSLMKRVGSSPAVQAKINIWAFSLLYCVGVALCNASIRVGEFDPLCNFVSD